MHVGRQIYQYGEWSFDTIDFGAKRGLGFAVNFYAFVGAI